jgi:diacylglycerol kinase (ATP)
MRVTIVVNPHSGKQKKHAENLEKLQNLFLRYPEIAFSLFETSGPGHATRLAEESAARGDKVCFAVGGDGTVNEVGCGLIGSNTSLGILPIGSGNGLARHLKIPLQLDQALDAQLNGESIGLDYGTANGVPFFLAAGIGFEGVVAARFATKKKRGFMAYILSAVEEYRRWKPIQYVARYEKEVLSGSAFTIDFANGSQYGNNAIISPGASVHDGLLQFVRVLPFPLHSAPEMFLKLMNGRIDRSAYHIERAFSRLELSVEEMDGIAGHVDGEPIQFQLPLMVEIHPEGIKMRMPYIKNI